MRIVGPLDQVLLKTLAPTVWVANMHTTSGLRRPDGGRLNCAAFNSDNSCFALAHAGGFKVYNSDPMVQWIAREFSDGGLGHVAMLERTNCLALVGGGSNPKYPTNKVIIWDDQRARAVTALEVSLPVLNVFITKTRVILVTASKVTVYSFGSTPTVLTSVDTALNPHGVAALWDGLLAVPAVAEGRVQLIDLRHDDCRVVSLLRAHKSSIRALAMNGQFLATASVTGTLLRVFSLETRTAVHEFRRGLDKATIYSLAFSPSDQLACLSDKKTLHVYDLHSDVNRRHALQGLPLGPKYLKSQWSYVSCHTEYSTPGVMGWIDDRCLVVVWLEAMRWEKYTVLSEAGELVREAWRRLSVD